MTMRELPRGEWRGYCDRISRELEGRLVELEIVGLDLGDRVEARWVPLLGLVYDRRADVLEVALAGLGHSIREPRELFVEETARGLVALEIVASDETRQVLRLREPLPLAAEQSAELREQRSRDEPPGA